ncbi:hypothetical protein D770_03295 [Flammeovirgaceae bacterium 311]|nr:hypothetical protein D770_03295 [Flammeovirgaceae bacterium 311]
MFIKLLLLIAFGFALPLQAQHRPRFLPDHATLQYAGSIGFLSAGFGYRNPGNTLEGEFLLGYLPTSIGGDRLFTTAIKGNWIPFALFKDKAVHFYPLQTGLMVAYTFGDQFFATQPSYYPKGYYTFSTAIHAYWQFGSRISVPLQSKRLEFYYEFNASAEGIVSMIQNPEFLTPDKVLNLALGIKLNFEP